LWVGRRVLWKAVGTGDAKETTSHGDYIPCQSATDDGFKEFQAARKLIFLSGSLLLFLYIAHQ